MSGDELKQIHQRIADLEAMLREPGRPKSRLPWRLYGALAALCLLGGGFAGWKARLPPQKAISSLPEVYGPEVVREGALVLANDDAPSLTKVDGKPYAFVVGYRPGQDDVAVVAFDRTNWSVAWRSTPYRMMGVTRGHVAATRGVVAFGGVLDFIVLDGRGAGEKFRDSSHLVPGKVFIDPHKPDWVVATKTTIPTSATSARAINVMTGEIINREAGDPMGCAPDSARTCMPSWTSDVPRELRAAIPGASATYVVQDFLDVFDFVKARVGEGPGQLEYAAVRRGDRVVWKAELAPDRKWTPWPNTVPEGKVAFSRGRILYSYVMPDGQQRITARAYEDGKRLYDEAIEGVGYGSELGELTAEGDEAFLVANQSLVVFDAATGKIKKRITAF